MEYKPVICYIVDTRRTKEQSTSIILHIRYTRAIVVDADGFSGGLWFLYDKNLISLSRRKSSWSAINVFINIKPNDDNFNLSGIFQSSTKTECGPIWCEVIAFHTNTNHPSIIVGDFNTVYFTNKKHGGNPVTSSQAQELKEVMGSCSIEEIPTT